MWVLLIYAGVGIVLVLLALLFYLAAVSSRKMFRCPSCGETIRTEYLNASHCNMCGAPLKREG